MTDASRLPMAEKRRLRLGFIRLSDSAPLVMAAELGLYDKYGLEPVLCREVSWANLRDKVVTGDLDAAQMLAPLPLVTSLGAGGIRADMVTGMALSLNGNAITLGSTLSAAVQRLGGDAEHSAASTAVALGRWLRQESGGQVPTLAAAHSFSCHTFLLRLWLRAAGLDPERDVRIIVLPPEQMVDSLARGIIDGFCVGEPWNTIAVQHGIGAIQATGYQVWNNAPEKVLGVTEAWHCHHPATHLRLRLALLEACHWLAQPGNRRQAAETLSDPAYLDLPLRQLLPSLTGELVFDKGRAAVAMPDFHVFGRFQACFPWRSHAEWLLGQSSRLLGKNLPQEQLKALVQRTFRTDLYRESARHLDLAAPSLDYKPENRHAQAWEMEPGIELGPDLMLSGAEMQHP